jgi:negative regulator of replication initiation
MKTIQLEDNVFAALEKRVQGFHDTPNDVVKRLLEESHEKDNSTQPKSKTEKVSSNGPQHISALIQLVQSPKYLMEDAKGRYFSVLEFLYQRHKDKFSVLEQYGRGKRTNFAREAKTIEQSGNSTFPERIPNTPYFALTNLPNLRKRLILSDLLKMFHYLPEEISIVLKSIPDSGISRPKRENIFAGFVS